MFCFCTLYNVKNELWYYFGKVCVSKLLIKLTELAEQSMKEIKKNQKIRFRRKGKSLIKVTIKSYL